MSNKTISDTLYHFTGYGGAKGKTKDEAFSTLKAILNSSVLKLSRNEVIWGYNDSDGKKISGVSFSPFITCFTDTPLGFMSGHTRDFGKFGVGLSIDWVIKNKGQNVVYVRDGNVNHLGETISRMLTHLVIDKKSTDFPRKWMHDIVYITENMQWRHEREWRIVSDKAGEIDFKLDDVDVLICPSDFSSDLMTFLDSDPKFESLKPKVKVL